MPADPLKSTQVLKTPTDRDRIVALNEMVQAIFNEDVNTVVRLAQEGCARFAHLDKSTPLMKAAFYHKTACVKALIPYSNVNAKDSSGLTALMHATSRGFLDIVQLLIPVSDVNVKSKQGNTALMHAACESNTDVLDLLIPHSNVKASNHHGLTALMYAARYGFIEGVERLLPHSQVDAKHHDARTALEEAIQAGHLGVVKILAPHTTLWDEHHRSMLHLSEVHRPETLECQAYIQQYMQSQQEQRFFKGLVDGSGQGPVRTVKSGL